MSKTLPEELIDLMFGAGSTRVSRKKQAVPNDPIQQAKQKMLERKARRKKVAALVDGAAAASPTPLEERQAELTEKLKGMEYQEQEKQEKNQKAREYWARVERAARTLVGDAAVDAEYLKEDAEAETWKQKDPSKKRLEAKVEKFMGHPGALPPLEKLMPDIANMTPHRIPPGYTPTTIFTAGAAPEIGMSEAATKAWKEKFETPPDHLPAHDALVILRADRPITPKDALGPTPGIVRQQILGTAEWPRHITVDTAMLADYPHPSVRLDWGSSKLYFWLANGCAVYDVVTFVKGDSGVVLKGTLVCGTVFPLLDTPPATPSGSSWMFPTTPKE